MKLKSLREHYTQRTRKNKNKNADQWYPKVGYNSKDEIREKLGIEPDECNVYVCGFCKKFHTSHYYLS